MKPGKQCTDLPPPTGCAEPGVTPDRRQCEDDVVAGPWESVWAEVINRTRFIFSPLWPNQTKVKAGHSRTLAHAFYSSIRAAMCSSIGPLDYLEIGSQAGLSMSMVGALLRSEGVLGELVSVDPYECELGSCHPGTAGNVSLSAMDERIAIRLADAGRDPRGRRGYLPIAEWVYEVTDLRVTLVRQESRTALLNLSAMFDIVYIDGWHSELAVWTDLVLSLPRLRRGGVVMLDDWNLRFFSRLLGPIRALLPPFLESFKSLHAIAQRAQP